MTLAVAALTVEAWPRDWPMREPFAISRGVQTHQPTVQLRLTDSAGRIGRGEACGVDYQGETPATMIAAIETLRPALAQGLDRQALLGLLPAGGARFALDAALWDLEARQHGVDPFTASGLAAAPVTSAITIGIRDLAGYESAARRLRDYAVIKIKVDAGDPIAAIAAVHRAAPSARLIVDPNQAWSVDMVKALGPTLKGLGVVLLEQPVALGDEPGLDGHVPEVPLCADELIDDAADLARARGRFQFVNIKLDKCGGLTAALALADAAEAQGFGLMVGCMAGSSLSMAPAMVLAQRCRFVDLDGPLLQSEDIAGGFDYQSGVVARPHQPGLWG